jgi:hypothetical protein
MRANSKLAADQGLRSPFVIGNIIVLISYNGKGEKSRL